MFTKRQNQIITIISSSDTPVTGRAISNILNISLRTLQNEISSINKNNHLILSNNKGYKVNKERLNDFDNEIIIENDTNQLDFIKTLILSNEKIHIYDLADKLYVSTSTLEKNIKNYKKNLEEFNLHIIRNKSFLHIEGKEVDKRNFIKNLIIKEIEPAFNRIDNLDTYFPNTDIDRIESIISNSLNLHNYYIDDIYFKSLELNIIIALYRMKTDNYINDDSLNLYHEDSDEYLIAREICNQYSNHFEIHPNDEDVNYISNLLVGQIKPNLKSNKNVMKGIITDDFLQIIDNILKETFKQYLLDIDYGDSLYNFALHVNGLISRAKTKSLTNNEYLDNLNKSFPFMYDVSIMIVKKISDQFNIDIPANEISLITIHIGYLMENSLNKDNKINVLLYCDEYHHISENIHNQLVKNFSDSINIQTLKSSKELNKSQIFKRIDLVITTKNIKIFGKQTLQISPFYTKEDNKKIDNAISKKLEDKESTHLNSLFNKYFNADLFFTDDKFNNKNEIISYMADKLLEQNIVNDNFKDSVINRESLSSTCFFESFAIPHAMTLDAKKTMCCVLLSKNGLYWDDKKINLVLMIAVQKKDRKDFMDIYDGIVRLLSIKEKFNILIETKNYEQFITYLKDNN